MNAKPTPTNLMTVDQKSGRQRNINPHLMHRPFEGVQDLNNLMDKLQFAPQGEEH